MELYLYLTSKSNQLRCNVMSWFDLFRCGYVKFVHQWRGVFEHFFAVSGSAFGKNSGKQFQRKQY